MARRVWVVGGGRFGVCVMRRLLWVAVACGVLLLLACAASVAMGITLSGEGEPSWLVATWYVVAELSPVTFTDDALPL